MRHRAVATSGQIFIPSVNQFNSEWYVRERDFLARDVRLAVHSRFARRFIIAFRFESALLPFGNVSNLGEISEID